MSARSYLQFCGDDTTVTAAGCIDKVTAKWPKPARFDAPDCKKLPEKTSWSCPEVDTKNLYTPIRINTGLSTLDTGTGTAGVSPNGTPAAEAMLKNPHGVAYDEATHTLYIADSFNHQVKRVQLDH